MSIQSFIGKSTKWPPLLILLTFVLILVFRFTNMPDQILNFDVFGYYLYLPAQFIYHDLAFTDLDQIKQLADKYEATATLYQLVVAPNGSIVIMYPMGMAIFFAPFFFVGHLLATPLGFFADGLSLPYQYALTIGGMLAVLIGLIYFWKILRNYFTQRLSTVVFLVIVFGTNYFQLVTFDGTLLSHNLLFTLYALIIWQTIKYHQKQTWAGAIVLGLLCGYTSLVRPSEMVCVFIPLLWNVYNWSSLKAKIRLIKNHPWHILFFGLSVLIAGMPQLLYWKAITGSFIFYSYPSAGMGFDFFKPYTLEYLFSFRKGWLVYTPIMTLSLVGFVFLFNYKKEIFWAALIFFLADLWFISSWSTWWYAGGSYSSRGLLPAYVVLAIPLGYFFYAIRNLKAIKIFVGITIAFLMILNLFQTWQWTQNIITRERMTREYYFAIFGKTSVDAEDKKLLLVSRSNEGTEFLSDTAAYVREVIFRDSYDRMPPPPKPSPDGGGALLLNASRHYSTALNQSFAQLTSLDHCWIKASVSIFIPEGYEGEAPFLVLAFHHKGKPYKMRSYPPEKVIPGTWHYIEAFYLTPEVRSVEDNLKVFVWQRNSMDAWVDDLKVERFELRE